MKAILIVAMLLVTGSVWAQVPPEQSPPGQPPQGQRGPGGGDFAQRKEAVLQRMQTRLQNLQNAISCVQAAQDPAALRSCREQERAQDKAVRQR